MRIQRSIKGPELYQAPDPEFKISVVHRFILKFAKERNNTYSLRAYREHVRTNVPDKKAQDNAIRWNRTTVTKMVKAGYLIDMGRGEYQLNPLALTHLEEMKAKKAPFELKENHRNLLVKNQDGILTTSELKAEHKEKQSFERERQNKLLDGMIRNLKNNGYLEAMGSGAYKLTEIPWLELKEPPQQKTKQKKPREKADGLKVTAYDRTLLEVSIDGLIRPELLDAHMKSDSLKKRIETLKTAGFIKENRLTDDLLERIEITKRRSQEKTLTFETLTRQQQQVLVDMRLFLNLTQSQMIKYIYKGNEELAKSDLKTLLEKGILIKDSAWNVYVLGKAGVKLTNQQDPEAVRYKTKLFSRREEVGHDVLVYTAYKELEKEMLKEGKQIISIKNDRQLRSEDAKKYGAMTGSYPDLRVAYIDPKTGKERIHDLEIDCGYDERTIRQKLSGFTGGTGGSGGTGSMSASSGFGWYCNSMKQALKVAKVVNEDKSKKLSRANHLSIYVIDERGDLKPMKWW